MRFGNTITMVPVDPQSFAGIPGMNTPPTPEPSPWAAWTAPDRSFVFNNRIESLGIGSPEAYRQIGHSFAALIVATLGGLFARNRYHVCVRDGQARSQRRLGRVFHLSRDSIMTPIAVAQHDRPFRRRWPRARVALP